MKENPFTVRLNTAVSPPHKLTPICLSAKSIQERAEVRKYIIFSTILNKAFYSIHYITNHLYTLFIEQSASVNGSNSNQ